MQIRHDICKNCNQCLIARVCPSDAFVKVSPDKPYLFRKLAEDKA
jgi:electron transport complex protein RnfB